ncbi:MAG TPA: hypothetical protein VH255_00005, partial [Verrucomicrobiae bacterium]|nr:hypothetical protein [Verrucomicrobiae bacterium]
MNDSTPVTPLSYYEQSGESWILMTRVMSIVAIAEGSLVLVPFIVSAAFIFWPLRSLYRMGFGFGQ